jgi:hypothetical protein
MVTPKKARKTKKEKNVSSKPQEQQKHRLNGPTI